jgi:hypothetical protein
MGLFLTLAGGLMALSIIIFFVFIGVTLIIWIVNL